MKPDAKRVTKEERFRLNFHYLHRGMTLFVHVYRLHICTVWYPTSHVRLLLTSEDIRASIKRNNNNNNNNSNTHTHNQTAITNRHTTHTATQYSRVVFAFYYLRI